MYLFFYFFQQQNDRVEQNNILFLHLTTKDDFLDIPVYVLFLYILYDPVHLFVSFFHRRHPSTLVYKHNHPVWVVRVGDE